MIFARMGQFFQYFLSLKNYIVVKKMASSDIRDDFSLKIENWQRRNIESALNKMHLKSEVMAQKII